MWLIVDVGTKQQKVHSVHLERAEAEAWSRCLNHQGDMDTIIVAVEKDEAIAIAEALEKM